METKINPRRHYPIAIIFLFSITAFLFFLLPYLAHAQTAGTGVPASAHPRLWLDSATTARLQSAFNANGTTWSQLKSFCDTETAPSWNYQGDQFFRYAPNFALCYRITGSSVYANKALAILNNNLIPFSTYSTDSGYGIRNYVPGIAITYDWLYDYPGFTEAMKTSARNKMNAWINWYKTSGYAGRNDYYISNYISNYNSGFMLARVLAGIAMYGEDTTAPTVWTEAIAHFKGALTEFDAKMSGGHWPEGWNYGAGALERYAMAASALRTSTTDSGYGNSSWLKNNVLFKLNALSGDGNFFYDDGGWTGDTSGLATRNDMYAEGFLWGWGTREGRIARIYDNTVAAAEPVDEWKTFLYFDPASTPENLSSEQRSYHANGMGLVTMRSLWNSASSVWASFMAGPYLSYQGAQDMDQGNIEIYKGAKLLMDAGHDLYGTDHFTATKHHNTYTIENRTGYPYSAQYYVSDCPSPTTGIKTFADSGDTVFTSGEFADAYDNSACTSPGIARLMRNILYVRPGLFLVYDQIEKLASQMQASPHMHLHFPTQPTSADANRQLTVNNGSGRLNVGVVFPQNAVATLGTNAASGAVTPGWHLEVRAPNETPAYHRFLTVLRAGDNTASYTAPVLTSISGTSAYGVAIDSLTSTEATGKVVTMFVDNGTTNTPTSISYQSAQGGALAKHYVVKLKANTSYVVSITTSAGIATVSISEGTGSGSVVSNSAGVISFNETGSASPPPTSDTTVPSTPTGLTATAVSTSQINLSWTASTDNVGVTGYNVYRGGVQIASIAATSYNDTTLTASTLYTYYVRATDAAGNLSAQSAPASATTQGTTPPPTPVPTVTLGASPTSVTSGGSTTLTWNSTNATSCTASGSWSGAKTISGSQSIVNLTASATYTLSCTGAGGTATQNTTVTVTATSPPSSGSISLRLVPSVTSPGTNELVSLGVPFPPNTLFDATRVRVLNANGTEIPAYVNPIAYWHFLANPTAIRSVLVQFRMDMSGGGERTVTIDYLTTRQSSLTAQVYANGLMAGKTTGAEIARILTVLPADWLANSQVAGPQVTKSANTSYPDYETWFETFYAAAQNYSYTTDTNWLFDRATTIYKQYIRTGNVNYLREAYNSATFYRTHIGANGSFDLRSGDWKYTYAEPLAIHYLLTGDERFKTTISSVASGWRNGFDPSYTVGNGFWTERHAGMGWLTALHAWQILGTQSAKDYALYYANTLIGHVSNPPDGRGADGCWRHQSYDHDSSEFNSDYAGCSAWMSTITLDALWQYYAMTSDARVGPVAQNFVSFLNTYGWVATDRTYYFPSSKVASTVYRNAEDAWTDLHNLEMIFAYSLAYKFDTDATRRQSYLNKINQIRSIFTSGASSTFRSFNWAFRGTSPFVYLLSSGTSVPPPPTSDTTFPTVSLTAPVNGVTVSGTATVSATASDNVGVAGVQFKLNGANLGVEDTTSPYSASWNTTLATNGTHTLTATARDAANNQTTSSGITVTVSNTTPTPDTTAPSIPANLFATAVSSSQISLSWTASTDNVGVTGYRVYRGGTFLTTVTTTSYSNTGLSPSTTYSYTVQAIDAANNVSTQSTSASATTLAGTTTPPPTTTGLVAHWKFDNNTLDSVGTNNGTGTGVTFTTDVPSSVSGDTHSANFNGSASIGLGNALNGLSTNTTAAWVKLSGSSTWANSTFHDITTKFRVQSVSIYKNASGQVKFRYNSGDGASWGTVVESLVNLTDGVWTHIAAVQNGTSVSLYINGVLDRTGSTGRIMGTNTSSRTIGSDGASDYFSGQIDDMRVYNVALSAAEITALASTSTTPPPTPPPTVSISAFPTSVTSGSSATLSWSSTNATSCTASGGWSGAKSTSGSQTLTNLTTTATYTLSCTGTGGTSMQSVLVTVVTPPTCITFSYSGWGSCQSNNTQSRTTTASSPQGCIGGTPVLTQSCVYTPPTPPTQTTCTSFTYSAWDVCQSDSTQSRTTTSTSPQGCTGGTPTLSQSCIYTPPAVTPPPATGGGGGGTTSSGGGGSSSSGGGTTSTGTTSGGTTTGGTTSSSGTTSGGGTSSSGGTTTTTGTTGGTSSTGTPGTLPSLTGPFGIGQRGDQVKLLQQILILDGSLTGEATGYYGPLTQRAVETFQIKYSLVTSGSPGTTGFGLAGPGTRAKLNSLYAGTSGGMSTDREALLASLRKQVAELIVILQGLIAKLAALKAAQGVQ